MVGAGVPLIAGCSESQSTPGESGTSTPSERNVQSVSEILSCSDVNADGLLRVTPTGATVFADKREPLVSFKERLGENHTEEMKVIELENRYALELYGDNFDIKDIEVLAEQRSGITGFEPGLSEQTVLKTAEEVMSSLSEPEEVEEYTVYHVDRESKPDTIVGEVITSESLNQSKNITFYAEVDGKRTLLAEGSMIDVEGVEETDRGLISVRIQLSDGGEQQFAERLSSVVDLSGGVSRKVIQVYLGNESVMGFGISRSFAETIQSGDWDGSFRLGFNDESKAKKFSKIGGLIQVSVPADTKYSKCG